MMSLLITFTSQMIPLTSEIDHYDFYYNPKELQEHSGLSMLDDDFIPNIQSPTSQKWSYFLHDSFLPHVNDLYIAYPDLITFATNISQHIQSHELYFMLSCLFYTLHFV
jgi:hypothetical protein